MQEHSYSQNAGPIDEATLRVVLATGSTFPQEQLSLAEAAQVVTPGSASAVTISSADVTLQGRIIANATDQPLFIYLGAAATLLNYTKQIAPGDSYTVPFRYTGIITGINAAAATGDIIVTELRE